jgi:hypothetical protein
MAISNASKLDFIIFYHSSCILHPTKFFHRTTMDAMDEWIRVILIEFEYISGLDDFFFAFSNIVHHLPVLYEAEIYLCK